MGIGAVLTAAVRSPAGAGGEDAGVGSWWGWWGGRVGAVLLMVKALCSEKEGEGAVSERLPGETWGVVDVDKGGNSNVAAALRPAYGNPELGAWGWAGVGRCNCYMSEPEHAQQFGSQRMKHSMHIIKMTTGARTKILPSRMQASQNLNTRMAKICTAGHTSIA